MYLTGKGEDTMVVNWQVKKVGDVMFMLVPGFCPCETQANCDDCKYSNVEFKSGIHARKSIVRIGYVSCCYTKAAVHNGGFPC